MNSYSSSVLQSGPIGPGTLLALSANATSVFIIDAQPFKMVLFCTTWPVS